MYKTSILILTQVLLSNARLNPYGPTVITDCTKCLNTIIQNEFIKPGLVIFSNTHNSSTSVLNIRTEVIKAINREIKFSVEVMSPYKEVEVCNQDFASLGQLHVDHYQALPSADYFIIIIDGYQDFSYLASKIIRSRSWNPNAKFLILLLNFINPYHTNIEETEKILTCLFKYNAINIVLVLPQANNYRTANIYSWQPYDPPKFCGYTNETAKDRLINVDVCEHGTLKRKNNLFVNKIPRNMIGCVLDILALPRNPYISEDESEANIEKVLANRLLKRFNITPNYKFINDFRGERHDDGHWSGALKKLATKTGHILLGGIFPDYDVHEDFECSTTYLSDAYTWVVPRASKMPKWTALLIIFEAFVWYSAIAGFVICAISWTVIGKLSRDSSYNTLFNHCFLNTWICVIGFVAYKRPVKESLKVFFVFLNLYSMLFLTAYTTKLFDTLTNPSYEYQIQTVEELVNSGLKFGGFEELHDLFVNSSDPFDYYIDAKWIEVNNITAAIIDVAVHKNFSMLCSRLQLGHLSAVLPELSDSHGNYKYYAFKSDTFSVPVEIIALKGFPFMHQISKTITFFKQSGLYEALKLQYADFNGRRRARLLRSILLKKHDINPLSVMHLQGGFLALGFGYLSGSLIFILEIVIHSKFIQRNFFKH